MLPLVFVLFCVVIRSFCSCTLWRCSFVSLFWRFYLLNINSHLFVVYYYYYYHHHRRTVCLFLARQPSPPQWARASSFTRFLDHTQRRTTVCRTPVDGWSARLRGLHLTTHNTHNKQTSMPHGAIVTHILSRGEAAELRLRPRGHWDRQNIEVVIINLLATDFFFSNFSTPCI